MASTATTPTTVSESSGRARFGYNAALDGLRAFSVVGVVLGHAQYGRIAGYHGVSVFFVISGYLITSLLMAEHDRSGTIRLGHFYLRRFARLAPVMVLVTILTAIWLLLIRVPIGTWWAGVVGTLTYTMDLIQAIWGNGNVSDYFQFTWSLGIEEQFYLIWPILLLILLRRRSTTLTLVVLGVFYVLFWVLRYHQDHALPTHERQFYGPISHGDSLILGCIIAVVLARWGTRDWIQKVATFAGPIGVIGLVVIALNATGFAHIKNLDVAGFGQTALFSAGVVFWVAVEPRGVLGRFFSLRPLAFVGKLSYGIYLWNLLLMWGFTYVKGIRPGASHYFIPWLAVLLLVSWASYRFVETPLRLRWAPPHNHAIITRSPAQASPAQ